tara:strand:- start:191 stop:478 length:288 start_codon:yes stop_codon:yes gene_type:complete
MNYTKLFRKILEFILSVGITESCSKYSEMVSGTYIGEMTINDSIISNGSNIIISEISVSSDFFNPYELNIEKQRYFSSVTYYHSQNPSTLEELEI